MNIELPEGYTVIRHGLFQWTFRTGCFVSNFSDLTRSGTIKRAARHAKLMKELGFFQQQ